VVVIGFPHRGGLRGCAWPDASIIETPLGPLPLDREFAARLPFPTLPEDELCDHSVEIQLPFLQRAAPNARVALLYAGRMDPEQRRQAAASLAAAWHDGTILVASSDLTHYGRDFSYQPFPPDRHAPHRIESLDRDAIEAAGSLRAGPFLAELDRSHATVCGRDPIALLLDTIAARHPGLWQETLDYQASGELTGSYEHSVSYAALGYFPTRAFALDETDRACLLDAAEHALDTFRQTGKRVPTAASGGSPAIQARRAVFVTVRHQTNLRGCLGNVGGRLPLALAVPELALSAALDDPRFNHGNDLPPLDVEISVLTPHRMVRDEDQVEVGRHGVHLDVRGRQALLLPQVAPGRGWDREQLLAALARKSCLPNQAWRTPGAKLSVFEAQVFSRGDL
jgi:AmmeMemoRadiSam system protein A/AmmeMemoRadiSam system protein B